MNKPGFIRERLKELNFLGKAVSLLHWDQQVLMPHDGARFRGEQLAFLAKLRHEKLIDPGYVELLREAGSGKNGDDEAALLREALRDAERAAKVPPRLVEEMTRLECAATAKWEEARKKNSFEHVAGTLEELLGKKREHGEALETGKTPYDALIDLYEPEMASEEIDRIFMAVRRPLAELAERIVSRTENKKGELRLGGKLPRVAQREFFREVIAALGFRLSAGRLDESTHPFCSDNCNGDVRLTTRIDEADLFPGLMALIHETGHGLYEQGLRGEFEGTPLGEASSLGIHESQSLLWEKQVGRSKEFWEFLLPKVKASFPEAFGKFTVEEVHRAVNQVRRSLIRVDADEVTYGLHVIARYELERELILGRLKVSELREAWREKYRELLGIVPEDDLTGVLQDTHWYIGAVGYFPTYLLGAMNAAQLFAAYREGNPGVEEDVRVGKFAPLLEWLREKIHRHGRKYPPRELMKRATGKETDPGVFVRYLEGKYGEMYGL
jgi:carboxypeptidase Taq